MLVLFTVFFHSLDQLFDTGCFWNKKLDESSTVSFQRNKFVGHKLLWQRIILNIEKITHPILQSSIRKPLTAPAEPAEKFSVPEFSIPPGIHIIEEHENLCQFSVIHNTSHLCRFVIVIDSCLLLKFIHIRTNSTRSRNLESAHQKGSEGQRFAG